MKAEILRLLRETDGYVSGQELCNQFGVSRTAVWKAINQLKEAGYEIEAVQNKGYHLVSVPPYGRSGAGKHPKDRMGRRGNVLF